MIRFYPILLGSMLVLGAAAGATHPKETRPAYLGAIAIEAESGRVLFEDKADVVTPPASMTKLMTFAVVHDRLASGALTLATPVTVTAEDSRIGGTQVWLKQGEIFPVEELLYAMMIQSGNDTAHALARAVAGTPAAFVELMNAKARALGMTHTTFRTPHGLPPANRHAAEGDLTTPRDYAVLSRYLVRETDVTKYTSIRLRKFGEGRRTADRVIQMTNHNHLLEKVAGVDGLKTGFTNGAGYCLAATAERGGRRVIVVVMGSPDSKSRDLKVIELLEHGFAALPAPSPAKATATPPAPVSTAPTAAPMPTVKTDRTPAKPAPSAPAPAPAPAPATNDSGLIFRVIPPTKKP